MKKPHHRIIAYVLAGALVCVLAVRYIHKNYDPAKDFEQITTVPHIEPGSASRPTTTNPTGGQSPAPSPNPLPAAFSLKVPFTPQAPTGNWDELHNEACEEASVIMAYKYFEGDRRPTIPPAEVEVEIAKLTEWEENHFGYHLDINSQETAQMAKEVYGLNAKIITDFTEEDVKNELKQNHVVLWPANGKLLGNPNFRSPGPPYHMVVVKGYNNSQFITNDPGTRKGMNYPYSYSTLYKANGNFDHETHEVNLNQKMIIVVWK
jgi:hypothetical protein